MIIPAGCSLSDCSRNGLIDRIQKWSGNSIWPPCWYTLAGEHDDDDRGQLWQRHRRPGQRLLPQQRNDRLQSQAPRGRRRPNRKRPQRGEAGAKDCSGHRRHHREHQLLNCMLSARVLCLSPSSRVPRNLAGIIRGPHALLRSRKPKKNNAVPGSIFGANFACTTVLPWSYTMHAQGTSLVPYL